jgi:hypothetical protein
MGAVLRRGRNQIFSTSDGPLGMNGATFLFQEGAGDFQLKIASGQRKKDFIGPFLGAEERVEQARLLKALPGLGESASNFGSARLGKLLDQIMNMPGFHFRNRHQLAATGPASLLATDFVPVGFQRLRGRVHHSIRQDLDQGQHLPQPCRSRGDGDLGLQFPIRSRQVDGNGDGFRRRE